MGAQRSKLRGIRFAEQLAAKMKVESVAARPDPTCAAASQVHYGAYDIPEELPDPSSI